MRRAGIRTVTSLYTGHSKLNKHTTWLIQKAADLRGSEDEMMLPWEGEGSSNMEWTGFLIINGNTIDQPMQL